MCIKLLYRFQQKISLFLLTLFCSNFFLSTYASFQFYNQINNTVLYKRIALNPVINNIAISNAKAISRTIKQGNSSGVLAANNTDKNLKQNLSIGGPTQPEATSFQSVNNNDMVDLFSGDFSYNIPLLDVGGYPVNLFYRSGVSMDQEASWVGLGWNINPGSITRNMRGLPDEFEGDNDKVTKVTSIKDNNTVEADVGADVELFGLMGVSASVGVFKNTYKGWGVQNSINTSISAGFASMGRLTAGLSIQNNSQEGLTIAPGIDVGLSTRDWNEKSDNGNLNIGGGFSFNSRSGLRASLSTGVNLSLGTVKNQDNSNGSQASLYNSSITFVSPSYVPTVSLPYRNSSYTFTLKIGNETDGVHPSPFIRGYASTQQLKDADTLQVIPAYGYLNYQQAKGNQYALLDFNREKELVYRQKPEYPNIAIPSYTYDCFSINSEGTGGMFRPYRSDIGYVYDHAVTTKDNSNKFSLDLGFGWLVHGGINWEATRANTSGGPWTENNVMAGTLGFRQSDSNFQNVYFKNPGEKTVNTKDFYTSVGNDDVVTVGLYQSGSHIGTTSFLQRYSNRLFKGSSLLTPFNSFKPKRDKRSEVITYLNATEASVAGLDKFIKSYALNKWGSASCSNIIQQQSRSGGMRKPNHISEIDVLNKDGKRYVYGIPVYNKFQDEVTYSVNSSTANKQTGLAPYNSQDDGPSNSNGIDWYYNRERIPAYSSSFLLTGILSTDYVDVTGNGITEDDLGDAIKFNYTQIADSVNAFTWRAPYSNQVTYNEGLQSYNRDDKGSYIFGAKELWYLNSIESKNMVAQFIIENRSDLKPIDKAGVISSTTPAKRLKEIRLYSKSDFMKDSSKAKPIKTVHFSYDSSLCKNPAQGNQGKLTLKKIWFTYNGNEKGTQNPYIFNYNNSNPSYDNRSYDRWGTYKPATDNPHGTLTNAEYPYAIQDSVKANTNAAAWTLDSIQLPSGGRMKISYESDDYAYVQNKRAMQMFNIIGLSRLTPVSSHTNGSENDLQDNLYRFQSNLNQSADNLYVGIKVSQPVSSKAEVFDKYLSGLTKLYFKLKVEMPTNEWGSGYEYLPAYAEIDYSAADNFGYLSNDPTIIWVKLIGINLQGDGSGSFSPLAKAAIQFLRINLPSKAYPGSETNEDFKVFDAVLKIANLGGSIFNAFTSFDQQARENNWAVKIDDDRSWVRLNNPGLKKFGGGLRVKSIKIYDHWYDMTSNAQKEAVYGQEYDYTLKKNVNGIDRIISSGVASYEPMLGNEENPWRLPVEYIDKVAPLAPVTMGYSETPFGESFFPAPSVGYSQVRVKSINIKGIKSANGFEETRFYTSYDFPTLVDNSMLNGDNKKHYNTSIGNFLKLDIRHFLAMSQGFKIELNDMNGKMRSQASYTQTDLLNPINYTENFYKVDDKNAEFKHLSNVAMTVNAQGDIDTTSIIGKNIELMMDMRQQTSLTEANNYNTDIDAFMVWIVPVVIPSFIPLPQREENRFLSTATTKIVNRCGILDSIVVIDKGSRVSTQNLLYDSESGDVLLTCTRNEFNDSVFNLNYPAYWAYPGMGPASVNVGNTFGKGDGQKLAINNGLLQTSSRYPFLNNYFESGDELLVYGKKKIGEDTVVNCSGAKTITNKYSVSNDYTMLWVVDSKNVDSSSLNGLLFLDRDGTPFSGIDLELQTTRSGHRNIFSNTIYDLTCLKTPIKVISNKLRLSIDSTINVLNTSATTYNNKWKVEDAMYLMDSCAVQTVNDYQTLYPTNVISSRVVYAPENGADERQYSNITNTRLVGGYYFKDNGGSCHTLEKAVRTSFNFNFQNIPASAVIDNASLSLKAGSARNTTMIGNNEPVVWDNQSYAHYYNGETGQNGAFINLMTSVPINGQDPRSILYDNSDSAQLTVSSATSSQSCTDYTLSATKIVKKYLNNKASYTGFLIRDINDNENFGNCDFGTREMSFCAGTDGTGVGCSNCSTSSSLYVAYHYNVLNCVQLCRSAITQKKINPYVDGLLGNWRSSKSYTFYADRRESNLSLFTNLRKDGVVQSFKPFWSFSGNSLVATTDTTNWVWNTQLTLYNRKGFEIENKDPLGRYNAGSYGYNQSLPISVTQNSQYAQQFFDGMEDYTFNTSSCTPVCLPLRNVNLLTGTSALDSGTVHTGIFSLKVNSKDSSVLNFPVASNAAASLPSIKALQNNSSQIDTIVTPNGSGLKIGYDASNHPVAYTGYLQAEVSGTYTVSITALNPAGFTLQFFGLQNAYNTISLNVYLQAGVKNNISIYTQSGGYFTSLDMSWKKPCQTSFTSIDSKNLYNLDLVYGNSVVYDSSQSNKLLGLKTDSSSLLPTFKPVQGVAMYFSAWVKEQRNCLCEKFDSNAVNFTFKRSQHTDASVLLKPSGNIIEGWERYEGTIEVPLDAYSMRLAMKSLGSSPVYFDDIRMHPFNANMKSFVYDPVSLRLMAELDENNYASFYEYDSDGTLVRIKKETEKGIQTIKETRSHLTAK